MLPSIFTLPTDSYKRDLNHLKHYVRQTSFYISTMTGKPLDVVEPVVRRIAKAKLVNPTVLYYQRFDNLDKDKQTISLLGYINDTIKRNEILVPTFTTYVSQDEFTSPFSDFMIENKKNRSVFKKRSHEEKMKGNYVLHTFYDKEQNNAKTYNNAGSGCFGSKGSILFNPTCHSALTSSVRTETSVCNASNERLLEGNRHYRNVDIILNNLISIASDFDRPAMEKMMNKLGIRPPTVEEVIEVIDRSFSLYAYDRLAMSKLIVPFVKKLDDMQRSAFVYTGDLYHLNKYNPQVIMTLLDGLSCKYFSDETVEDPSSFLHKFEEGIVNHVLQIFCEQTLGIPRNELVAKLGNHLVQQMYSTAKGITEFLENYREMVRVFFLTKHLPPSTAYIYSQVRRAVPQSDTDATMFSVDTLVEKRFGHMNFTTQTKAFASSVCLFTTQVMSHQLAIFSANMGVRKDKIHSIAMKPEYTFPFIAATPVAKHYFTLATVQEGMHFSPENYKYEYKGVHLINSAHPKIIRDSAKQMMASIANDIYANKPLNIREKIAEVIQLEQEIKRSLLAGENTFYRNVDIKIASSYKSDENSSPYRFHLLWEEVFKPKYGAVEEPDYRAIKLPLTLTNKLKVKAWLTSLKDQEFAERMSAWLTKHQRKDLMTLYICTSFIQTSGIPEELVPVLDIKRIILDLTVSRRMILSALGVYPKVETTLSEMYLGKL